MPDCYLTRGREALIARLQADDTLSEWVRSWFTWSGDRQVRLVADPAHCPYCGVAPDDGGDDQDTNASSRVTQGLVIAFGNDAMDVAGLESALAALRDICQAARDDALGLSGEGLVDVRLRSWRWIALPAESGSRVVWTCECTVELRWRRTT